MYFACVAHETPNERSGGFVWYPYSVIQIGLLPQRRFSSFWRSPRFASVTAFVGGRVDGVSLRLRGYAWCAYASNRFIPAFFAARMNASGETVGREPPGLLPPPGAVTPHATFSPAISVDLTPV